MDVCYMSVTYTYTSTYFDREPLLTVSICSSIDCLHLRKRESESNLNSTGILSRSMWPPKLLLAVVLRVLWPLVDILLKKLIVNLIGFCFWVSFLILTQILPWPSWHKTDFANVSNDLTWSKNAIFQNKSRIIKLVLWKIFFPCSPVYVARLRQMVGWSATQINAFPIWVHLRVTGAPGIWVRSNIELFCRLDEDEEGEKDKENEEDEED